MSKKERVNYSADGIVLGNLWGGGKGYYPARKYYAETFTKLKNEIKEDFESGALDSGMGYESLLGAMMVITKHIAIEIEGVCFGNESKRRMWLGKINKREAREVYRNYV